MINLIVCCQSCGFINNREVPIVSKHEDNHLICERCKKIVLTVYDEEIK